MRVHCVVVLHPTIDQLQSCGGIRDRVDPDIIALEGFHEGFGHAVTLRTFDRGEARDQVERQGNLDGLVGGEDRAVVRQLRDDDYGVRLTTTTMAGWVSLR